MANGVVRKGEVGSCTAGGGIFLSVVAFGSFKWLTIPVWLLPILGLGEDRL